MFYIRTYIRKRDLTKKRKIGKMDKIERREKHKVEILYDMDKFIHSRDFSDKVVFSLHPL